MRRTSLLAELGTGGLRVVTRLGDGTVGAVFVIQPDGDIVNQMSRSFLADAGAQARHLHSIEEMLEALRGVRRLVHVAIVSLGGVTSYLAAHGHDVFAFSVVLGLVAQLARGRLRKPRRSSRTRAS